jgi:oligopeptidase B
MGGFEESNYVTERKWASAQDGTQIPISIVYRKDNIKLDGSDPLLLYGYGSYEVIKEWIGLSTDSVFC